ncbi:ester cyclase [Paenarthrobacter sp. NPDC057981]|uniref:ester cyclase n=1 Tax=Paenarthrobacter sp. NPDC057981 TaxID=3346297 RepID=UPI0036DF5FE9
MTDAKAHRNIVNAKLLLEDAMPHGNFDQIRSLVTSDAPIRRAGFADLYALTGDDIPQHGNFVEWLEAGWKVLSAALTEQTSETASIVGDGDTVVLQFHMTALHTGTFAGAAATGKRVEWDEVGVLQFNEEGLITSLWFMCQELSLAQQIGYKPQMASR